MFRGFADAECENLILSVVLMFMYMMMCVIALVFLTLMFLINVKQIMILFLQ